MNYKKSLNLPATKFPMKANLAQREPLQIEKWESDNLYAALRRQGLDRKRFILHDGPPYANGHIHMGTALNKILKDIIVRSRQMASFDADYVPGWDCHGLPIEHNVDVELGDKKKSLSQAQIRKLCRRYAEKFIDIQRAEFQRLGVVGNWNDPYLTMNYAYEAIIARECCKFALNGSLYRSKKPIYWCSSCKTALAEAEIEYEDETSPSVYVKFALIDDLGEIHERLAGKEVCVVIWTTTPWTLPANLAIALHPDFRYAVVETGDGEHYIVARELVDQCMLLFGIESYTVVAEVAAAALENKSCRHPMYDRQSLIVLGDHVTLDAGTGCVHTAPGHGREDYDVARRYGLEAYSPVDDNGCFTDEIDAFAGQYVFDANSAIKAQLSTIGALLKSEQITHSYPHCWRCKQPVIFRATPQWFISMEKTGLREKSLAAIDRVHWIPRWGRERIYGMIENRPDWCVSRQRAWGVPITVFYCDDCESVYMTEAIMEKIHALFESHGADIWFEADIEKKLLPEGAACPQCGGKHLAKEDDILDVWFDSGVSHAAVLEARENLHWPADLYLEGSDQHRGWFHSALLTAVGTRGRAPYEAVLTHGFVVDSDGRKMSKSVGNVVAPGDVIKTYGAEVLRLWVTATDYRDDVRISEKILKQLSDAYRKIRNTCRFMLGNLSDFEPDKDRVDYAQLTEIDRFALHKLAGLVDRCRKAYDRYEFHTVYHALNHYCTVDLSAFYLDILKDRLYVTPPGDGARRAAQTVLYYTLENLVRIMAPILAFTAEELWAFVPGRKESDGSVHLQLFPEVQAQWRAAALAQKWAVLISVREEVAKALEEARVAKRIGHPLEAAVTINAGGDLFAQLEPYRNDLATIFITSQAELVSGQQLAEAYSSEQVAGLSVQVLPAIGVKCERCWMRAPSVGSHDNHPGLCNRCHGVIAGMEASPQQS